MRAFAPITLLSFVAGCGGGNDTADRTAETDPPAVAPGSIAQTYAFDHFCQPHPSMIGQVVVTA